MNCAKCGAQLDEQASTCSACGADVLMPAASIPVAQAVPVAPPATIVPPMAEESTVPANAFASQDTAVPFTPTVPYVLDAPNMPMAPPPPPTMLPPPPPPLPNALSFDEPNLGRWNWGAFALGIFWTIGMRLWVWSAVFVALMISSAIPALNGYARAVSLFFSIYLGIKGTRMAWTSPGRKWNSAKQFEDTQKVWTVWALVILALAIVIVVIAIAILSQNKGVGL